MISSQEVVQPPRPVHRPRFQLVVGLGLTLQYVVLARVVVPKLLSVSHVSQSKEQSLSGGEVGQVEVEAELVREAVARVEDVVRGEVRVRRPLGRRVPHLHQLLEAQVEHADQARHPQVAHHRVLQTHLLLPDLVQEVRVGPGLLELGDESGLDRRTRGPCGGRRRGTDLQVREGRLRHDGRVVVLHEVTYGFEVQSQDVREADDLLAAGGAGGRLPRLEGGAADEAGTLRGGEQPPRCLRGGGGRRAGDRRRLLGLDEGEAGAQFVGQRATLVQVRVVGGAGQFGDRLRARLCAARLQRQGRGVRGGERLRGRVRTPHVVLVFTVAWKNTERLLERQQRDAMGFYGLMQSFTTFGLMALGIASGREGPLSVIKPVVVKLGIGLRCNYFSVKIYGYKPDFSNQ